MKKQTAIIIITAITVIGLAMGPAASMLAKDQPEENQTDQANQKRPSGPGYITPLKEYKAQATTNVTRVMPAIIASATSNYGDRNELKEDIMSIRGVKNASVSRKENPGEEGLYKFDIRIDTTNHSMNERVNYYLKQKIGEKLDFGTKVSIAQLSVPKEVNATRKETGQMEKISLEDRNVTAMIYPHTNPGDSNTFMFTISMQGNQIKQIMAREGRKMYLPPTETWQTHKTFKIVEITGKEILAGFGNKTNTTELQQNLKEQGYNASVRQLPSENYPLKLAIEYAQNLSEPGVKGNVTARYTLGKISLPNSITASKDNETKEFNLTGFNSTSFRTKKEVEKGGKRNFLLKLETSFDDLRKVSAEIMEQDQS